MFLLLGSQMDGARAFVRMAPNEMVFHCYLLRWHRKTISRQELTKTVRNLGAVPRLPNSARAEVVAYSC